MTFYLYAGFDPNTNTEFWEPVSTIRLHYLWMKDVFKDRHCARRGYGAWLYYSVTSGPLLPREFLSFRDEII